MWSDERDCTPCKYKEEDVATFLAGAESLPSCSMACFAKTKAPLCGFYSTASIARVV